jgi:lysophospholipase L1-like esterase
MSTSRSNPSTDATADGTDRRQFLAQLGQAVCAGAIIAEAAGTADAQAPTPPKKKVNPTAGVEGIKQLLARKEPVTWVFTGDSITHGALHTKGWRSYPEHFGERVRWELKRMRDIVVNTGVSGEKADGLLADLDWRVLHLKPEAVSIMLGMNDCTLGEVGRQIFRKNLTAIVSKVMAAGAIPILNTPNTVFVKNADTRADLPGYVQVVRDVALGTKAILVDHYAHWEKVKPTQEALLKWLADESIHPNYIGHREMAKQLFTDLEIFDTESPTCQLEVV